MKKYIYSFLLFFPFTLFSQNIFKGMIMEKTNPKDNLGVAGVSVHWLNTNVGTTTNEKGWFTIPYKKTYKKLVISYLGYKTDTLTISSLEPLHHFLTPESELDEITIESKRNAVQKNSFATVNMFTVNSEELL